VSDDPFLFTGPFIPSGIVSPLPGVSPFFFLSDDGPNEVVFFDAINPFDFPGVIFACAATFAEVFFFLIVFTFGFSKKTFCLASSSSFFYYSISLSSLSNRFLSWFVNSLNLDLHSSEGTDLRHLLSSFIS